MCPFWLFKLCERFCLYLGHCILYYKYNLHLVDFSDLVELVELDLSLNFLSSVPVGALGQLRNLKFLNLGSNRIQVWQFLLTTYYFSFPPTKEMMRKCCFMVFKWKNSNLKWLLSTIKLVVFGLFTKSGIHKMPCFWDT